MRYILLIGAAFNVSGGLAILLSMWVKIPYGVKLPRAESIAPADYVQYRMFTAGAAFVFGALYYYLYKNPVYAMPFLVFGMALKYWAFLSSLVAYRRYRLPMDGLVAFGVSNLIVAILFSVYLLA